MRLFAHRLAVQLGREDVSGLMEGLSQRALLEWIAYFEREPWGEARADARSAIVAAVTFNMQRGRGQPARQAADFMAHRPSRAEATPAHLAGLKAALMSISKGRGDADAN